MKEIEVSASVINKGCADGRIGRVTGIVTFSEDGICQGVQCTSSSLGTDQLAKDKAKDALRKLGEAALIEISGMYPRYEKDPRATWKVLAKPGLPDIIEGE